MSNKSTSGSQCSSPPQQQTSKNDKIKECIQQTVSEKSKRKINSIINEIGQLSDIEKLLLYLQLPSGSSYDIDPLKQKGPGNPFGKKADVEVAQTWTWIQSHLEEDSSTSLPKHEVYEEYRLFCQANRFEPLCVADFGKAMKQIFPRVKPRRLGQRGNSKYCYSGLKKKLVVESPSLPDLDPFKSPDDEKSNTSFNSKEIEKASLPEDVAANHVVMEWAEKLLSQQFKTIKDLGRYLIDAEYVDNTSVAALTMISSVDEKQHNKTILKKTMNRGSKRDAQIHLQKKLHQKELINEQKKKLDLNKTLSVTKNVPVSVNKNSSNKKSKKSTVNLETTRNPMRYLTDEVKLKMEKADKFSEHQSSVEAVHKNNVQNKVPIPRSVASHVSNQLSTASIIVLPSLPTGVRIASGTQNPASETNGTQTVSVIPTSPIKSASKYKRIQPKPLPVNRSNSAIESIVTSSASNSSLDSNDNFDSNIKRRHSVSVPIANDSKHVQFEVVYEKQTKRHIDEKDINNTVSKKRLVDKSGNLVYLQPTNGDEAVSSASLSPVSQSELPCTAKTNGSDCGRQSLIVQELEQDCLREYFHETGVQANDCWDSSPEKLSQLRKILEEKLPQTPSKNVEQKQQLQGFSELRQTLMRKSLKNTCTQSGNQFSDSIDSNETQLSNNFSTSRVTTALASPSMESFICTNLNGSSHHNVNSLPSLSTVVPAMAANLISTNVQTQFPSVPPSPNTRRRAFSFQPISPRNTPTIPENSSVSSSAYGSLSSTSSGHSPPQYHNNQHSIAVGPSQSPSAANSPFVSPRSTPIPLSRSRHNSGQSTYSTSRQTPFQNLDSGVSSISSSPFISPQSTPVPISRVRVGSNGMQMRSATLRARHSSGPGNPYTSLHHTFSNVVGCRSSSLSPMVCGDMDSLINKNRQFYVNQMLVVKTEPNVGVSNDVNFNGGAAPTSPLFDPTSPNALSTDAQSLCGDLLLKESLSAATNERQRHMSSPYTLSPGTPVTSNGDSQEIQNLLKNFVLGDLNEHGSAGKLMLNRSHSVPVHQMKLLGNFRGNSDSPINLKTGNPYEENAFISKSYPATPVCNQSFQFPTSPPSSKLQTVNAIASEDVANNFIESGHDVMVSGGLQPTWTPGVTTTSEISGDNELITTSDARQNLNDLLTSAPPMEDELQTALEDLRDCDSEFSKFAQELEAMEVNDGTSTDDLS